MTQWQGEASQLPQVLPFNTVTQDNDKISGICPHRKHQTSDKTKASHLISRGGKFVDRCHAHTVRCKCVSCSAGRDLCDPPTKGVVGFDSVSHSPSISAAHPRGALCRRRYKGSDGQGGTSWTDGKVCWGAFSQVSHTRPGKMVCHEASGKYSNIMGGLVMWDQEGLRVCYRADE